jgi:hypothetical protein
MLFGIGNHDDAAQAVEDIRALITQQEYEYQRLVADLQLCAMTMEDQVELHKITDRAVKDLEAGWTNLKHDLRNARHELGAAVDRLQGLLDMLVGLEWRRGE